MSEEESGTLPLSADEVVALVAWQHSMLTADLAHTRSARLAKHSTTSKKEALAQQHLAAATVLFTDLTKPGADPNNSRWPVGANAALHESALEMVDTYLALNDARGGLVLDRGARECAGTLADRIEALRLQIELHAYQPWPPKVDWDSNARSSALRSFVAEAPALTDDDYTKVTRAFRSNLRQLKLKTTNWWRVAGFAGVGGILAVPAFFVAAPMVGAAIGGYMGLSGAAATSAGLAVLGGGSLAAGGMGIAGGTAVVVTAGTAVTGIGATSAAYFSPFVRESLVADAVKTRVLLQMLADSPGEARSAERDALQRMVVTQTMMRLTRLEDLVSQLGTKLQQVRAENRELRAENRELRAENSAVSAENRELRKELEASRARLEVATVAYKQLLATAKGNDDVAA